MVLKEKLQWIHMLVGESIASYLKKVKQLKDELEEVSVNVSSTEIVNSTLNGLPDEWEPFVFGVVAHENILDWDILWDDFSQEELKRIKKEAIVEDVLNLILTSRNKGKGKQGPSFGGEVASGSRPTKDMSRIKCYVC